jgi:superfamily II DNA or RNA helicase
MRRVGRGLPHRGQLRREGRPHFQQSIALYKQSSGHNFQELKRTLGGLRVGGGPYACVPIHAMAPVPKHQYSANHRYVTVVAFSKDLFIDGKTFEEYLQAELADRPDAEALSLADDELGLYQEYQAESAIIAKFSLPRDVPRHVPSLAYPYSKSYPKLEIWVRSTVKRLLEQMITDLGIAEKPSPVEIERLGQEFGALMEAIHQLDRRLGSIGPTLQRMNYLTPHVLRRLLKELGAPAEVTNDIAAVFQEGSTFYWLEFFARLWKLGLGNQLIQRLKPAEEGDLRRLAFTPMIRVELWKHQRTCYDEWDRQGRNGILEMATATGKTVVGLYAIQELAGEADPNRTFTVRIFCHSLAILNQWRREAIEKLDLPVSDRFGGNRTISLEGNPRIEISFDTVQSVYRSPELFPADLLIVDEVHHLAALQFSNALKIRAPCKLGLSAMVEGERRLARLEELLGPVRASYGLEDALRDGVIPSFEWILYKIPLAVDEDEEFRKLSQRLARLFGQVSHDMPTLQSIYGPEARPLQSVRDYFRALDHPRARQVVLPAPWSELRTVTMERRRVLWNSAPKIDRAIEVAGGYGKFHKCLVYTMTIATAKEVAERLGELGVEARCVHSEMSEGDREATLQWFGNVKAGALVGPMILDEGINLPEAEVGINIASSKTKLQLIQRLGRLLRKGSRPDKRPEFHHFVAVPEGVLNLPEEDGIQLMDDVSWAADTAIRLGIPLRFAGPSDGNADDKTGFKSAEEYVAESYRKDGLVALHSGSIRLGEILALYPRKIVRAILQQLESVPEGPMTYPEWRQAILRASQVEEPAEEAQAALVPPYNWYIYVIGGKDPRSIARVLAKGLEEPQLSGKSPLSADD